MISRECNGIYSPYTTLPLIPYYPPVRRKGERDRVTNPGKPAMQPLCRVSVQVWGQGGGDFSQLCHGHQPKLHRSCTPLAPGRCPKKKLRMLLASMYLQTQRQSKHPGIGKIMNVKMLFLVPLLLLVFFIPKPIDSPIASRYIAKPKRADI